MKLHEEPTKSVAIIGNLLSWQTYVSAHTVFSYVSREPEIDTFSVLADSKQILVPVIAGSSLKISQLESVYDLTTINRYGIKEPGKIVPYHGKIDLAIVPGVVFDSNGNRIGKGKGYYDRALCRLSCIKVSLAYESQLTECIPTDSWDVCMDYIITENRIIECNEY